jgi:hypothetical protein
MRRIELLGDPNPLVFTSMESALTISLPATLPGKYAYAFKIPGYAGYRR